MTDDLQPMTPREAHDMYLKARDIADTTRRAHSRRIRRLVRWCEGEGDIDNINELSGRDVHVFKIEEFAEKEDGTDYSKETIRSTMDTTRVFLRWCESIDAVSQGLSEKVQSPSPENTRDETVDRTLAANILGYLATYEYASFRHCYVQLLWHAGLRLGGVHALDLKDVHLDDLYLEIRHRPDEGTTLKNGEDGERLVNISQKTALIIEDYIENSRRDIRDDHGRQPLITSRYGRRSKTNLRDNVYKLSRPCVYANECPHDREVSECEAAGSSDTPSRCPSTVYPHAFRRGSITFHLREDTPKHLVSDRMDVNHDTLDKHYDTRSDEERMRQRRDYLPFGDDGGDESNSH